MSPVACHRRIVRYTVVSRTTSDCTCERRGAGVYLYGALVPRAPPRAAAIQSPASPSCAGVRARHRNRARPPRMRRQQLARRSSWGLRAAAAGRNPRGRVRISHIVGACDPNEASGRPRETCAPLARRARFGDGTRRRAQVPGAAAPPLRWHSVTKTLFVTSTAAA
eukprot:scaffold1383_cov360-Prasinococcus_capsulatus_cf.AAC.15